MEDTSSNPSMNRRQFLKLAGEVALGASATLLFGGCRGKKAPPPQPTDKVKRYQAPAIGEIEAVPPLTDQEVHSTVDIAIQDYKTVLGIDLPKEELHQNILILQDVQEYQRIIAAEEVDYQPSDELDRPAITTEPSNPIGKKIVVFLPSIDTFTKNLPNTNIGRQARTDIVESIFTHEIAHYEIKNYQSPELHALVYDGMLANLLRGHSVQPAYVAGSEVKAVIDGKRKSPYQVLEETEASLIGDFVMNNRGRNNVGSIISGEMTGVKPNLALYSNLLFQLNPNDVPASIRDLLNYRNQEFGREQWARKIGEHFQIPQQDRLFFGMSVLWTINTADQEAFQQLTQR